MKPQDYGKWTIIFDGELVCWAPGHIENPAPYRLHYRHLSNGVEVLPLKQRFKNWIEQLGGVVNERPK